MQLNSNARWLRTYFSLPTRGIFDFSYFICSGKDGERTTMAMRGDPPFVAEYRAGWLSPAMEGPSSSMEREGAYPLTFPSSLSFSHQL
jgi:hypothetical protein